MTASDPHHPVPHAPLDREIVLITGLSGSGKSVALHALEDEGYYCVDNLPPELLLHLVAVERKFSVPRLAIAMDARSASSLHLVPQQISTLKKRHTQVRVLFLDASSDTLVRRFSETRRKHPLSQDESPDSGGHQRALMEAIARERELLSELREMALVLDSSLLRPSQLRASVKALVSSQSNQLTLVITSFAFKRGIPLDADFVFDVRMLPNPYYEPGLAPLTGKDEPVVTFLREHSAVTGMLDHITQFLSHWLPALVADQRSYVTVAIGCTGGQHRSVFITEQLAAHFAGQWSTIKRHRELG